MAASTTCSLHFGDIISLYCESTIEQETTQNNNSSNSNSFAYKKAKANFKFKSNLNNHGNSHGGHNYGHNGQNNNSNNNKRRISGFISTLGLVDDRVVVQPASGNLDNPPVRFRDCMFRILPQSRYNARKQHWRSLQTSQTKFKDSDHSNSKSNTSDTYLRDFVGGNNNDPNGTKPRNNNIPEINIRDSRASSSKANTNTNNNQRSSGPGLLRTLSQAAGGASTDGSGSTPRILETVLKRLKQAADLEKEQNEMISIQLTCGMRKILRDQ